MSNLTYDQQKTTIGNRQINREIQRHFGEKEGGHEEYKKIIDDFRISRGLKPMYEKGK